jgi:uncharacterized protein DUF262
MSESQLRRKQTFQNIAWFLDLKNRGLLNMDPPYQRWSVWNTEFKQRFIETLLLGYPSPSVFLFRRVDERGNTLYDLVDGKQRLTSIFEFIEGVFSIRDDSALASMRGKYFQSLEKDHKIAFFDYDLSVEYLPTNNETVINDIFDRLNRNVARLTPQELRHAKYSGDFIKAAEGLATWTWGFAGGSDDEEASNGAIAGVDSQPRLPPILPRVSIQARRQMKDVEIVAALLLYLEEGIKSYTTKDLDKAFSDREEWDDAEQCVEEYRSVIVAIVSIITPPAGSFLLQSRLRNQADFYSFFAAVAALRRESRLPDSAECAARLKPFLEMVDSQEHSAYPKYVGKYYDAARSASNDLGSRSARVKIVKSVLLNEIPAENGT